MTIEFLKQRIRDRWATAEDFYSERDDRTKLELKDLDLYSSQPIEIIIGTRDGDGQSQQMALIACNLMARWARNVTVYIEHGIPLADSLRRHGHATLEDRILSEMKLADPFGNFQTRSIEQIQGGKNEAIRLFVGDFDHSIAGCVEISQDDLWITSAGQFAMGRRGAFGDVLDSTQDLVFTPSAALAAALGVADVFKRAVGHPRDQWLSDFCWDLLTHQLTDNVPDSADLLLENPVDISRILVAGVGAIGSSLIYLWDLAGLKGQVTILDRDRVETSNLNRSLLFNVCHVLENDLKTEIAQRYLLEASISADRLDGTWNEQATNISRENFDVWVSFTNEEGAWAELPFQLPPVVVQGTTTSGWGFGAGRHVPRVEDCTLCRMPRPESIFRGPCSEGEVPVRDSDKLEIRASLPFLSVASASLVLAELIKLERGNVLDHPNDIAADLRMGLPAVIGLNRGADENCRGCRILRSTLWEERGGRGRYKSLSKGKSRCAQQGRPGRVKS